MWVWLRKSCDIAMILIAHAYFDRWSNKHHVSSSFHAFSILNKVLQLNGCGLYADVLHSLNVGGLGREYPIIVYRTRYSCTALYTRRARIVRQVTWLIIRYRLNTRTMKIWSRGVFWVLCQILHECLFCIVICQRFQFQSKLCSH